MCNGPNPLFKPIALDGRRRHDSRGLPRRWSPSLPESIRSNQGSCGRAARGARRVRQLQQTHAGRSEAAARWRQHGTLQEWRFHHVIRHGGRLIALNEATSSYELSMELETRGEWTARTGRAGVPRTSPAPRSACMLRGGPVSSLPGSRTSFFRSGRAGWRLPIRGALNQWIPSRGLPVAPASWSQWRHWLASSVLLAVYCPSNLLTPFLVLDLSSTLRRSRLPGSCSVL